MEDFEKLYRSYYPKVYFYLLKLCQNEMTAEEITQETFIKALKSIDTYRGECQFSVWLCQIAKNTFYSYCRKNKGVTYCISEITNEEEDEKQNLEHLILNKEMAHRLHEILHKIDEPYKEVFWMRTFGELSFAEIAKLHKKTESWARVTYHRAKLKIQEEIEK